MREVQRNAYYDYFDTDGFIIGDLSLLPRFNSPLSMESHDYSFEVLKLDGDREIRFAAQKGGDCSCRNFITDSKELIHIKEWLQGRCGCKPELFDDFDFNIHEEYRLRKLLERVYDNDNKKNKG